MSYYLVDVSKSTHGIGYLTDAKCAVIESLDEDLYDARIKVHLVDYKQCRDSVTTFDSPSKQVKTWKIEKELNSLPSAHRFKVGDKVFLKKEPPPSDISHVYDAVYFRSEHEPITVSLLYYYEWNYKTYAVVGFNDSYGGWVPEDLLEHYTTTRPDPERDKGGFKVGEQVLVNVYQGCGIPYPLDRDETVTIVDDSYSYIAVGSDQWTHVAKWNNKYVKLDYVRGKFRHAPKSMYYKDKGGFSKGEYVYATNCGGNGLKREMHLVRIVDDSYAKDATGLMDHQDWTHVVQQDGLYYKVNYKTAKFTYAETVNSCKEISLPNAPYYGTTSHGTITSTGTVVTTDIYPGYEGYFRDVLASEHPIYDKHYARYHNIPEPIPEKETKIQILKLQQPIILKSKKHKSWK